MNEPATIERKELWGHPVGLYILFFTEMWERFSYYGMRAILVLYMISSATNPDNPGLGWSNESALQLYGWYTMLVYLMSIPGGILADKYIGQKKAVLFGGLVLVLGHSILALPQSWAFFTGLALIVIGVGGLKPNISTMVGGLYPQGDNRRDSGFTLFYIGINVGAFLAAIIVGTVGEKIGWHLGFGLAGIGMLLGQIVFMAGQRYLVGVGDPPTKEERTSGDNTSFGNLFGNLFKSPVALTIVLVGVFGLSYLAFRSFEGIERYLYAGLFSFLSIAAGMLMMIYKDIDSVEKDRFIVLLISFLIIIVFWGSFEQAGGLLNIYTAEKINRVVNIRVIDFLFYGGGLALLLVGVNMQRKKDSRSVLFYVLGGVLMLLYTIFRKRFGNPYEIPTSTFQSVNALFIIIFGTAVSSFWYFWKRKGRESSSLFKMAIGTIIMGAGFLFMARASREVVEYGDKAALILLILAYLFHTIGELCSSPVALSFITKIAPIKYVSIMMGVYFAATGLGNKLAGSIGEASQAPPVKVQLAQNPVSNGLVDSLDFAEAKDFKLVGKSYLDNDQIVVYGDKDFQNFIKYDQENADILKKYLSAEQATKDDPQTVIARYSYDKDEQIKVKEKTAKTSIENYSGKLEVFDYQNNLEYKTYIGIFILTLTFGLLLLLFLKKLKKLTHGAEEISDGYEAEAEGYDLEDSYTEELKDDDKTK